MVSQDGVNLALSLITSHFGDLVAKVCGCLLRKGTLTLHELVAAVQLSNSQVKNCLLVLIQHNCVQAFSAPRTTGSDKVVTQYMVIFDNILHRMRFSKFLAIIKEEDLGLQCENILKALLQNGRLTFDQLVERATSQQLEGSASIRDSMRMDFNRLIQKHYVERCPRPEPFVSLEGTTPARKRSSKIRDETPSIEQQAIVAATFSDAERFSEIMNTGTEVSDANAAHKQDISAGEKRKRDVVELDEDVQTTITENEVLWRGNFQKFILSLKKKACVANIRSRLGPEAGVVLEALIDSSDEETSNSVKAPIESILEAVIGKPGGIAMTLEQIRIVLDQLGCSSYSEDDNVFYSIELQSIIESCQNDEVESLVLAKNGKEAYRIFRFLIREGSPVETDQISDKTLVDKKDCQKILYKLWNDDYLRMQRVIPIGAGFMHYFLWKVEKDSVWKLVLDHMYHAALNLNEKIAQIAVQEHEVQARLVEKRKEVRNRRGILEASLLKLDDAVMLFHDFKR